MANLLLFKPTLLKSRKVRDVRTYEKIQKHLSDINDKITDEDIREMQIGIPNESQPLHNRNFLNTKKEKV
jgi:hypothetical protein